MALRRELAAGWRRRASGSGDSMCRLGAREPMDLVLKNLAEVDPVLRTSATTTATVEPVLGTSAVMTKMVDLALGSSSTAASTS